MKVFNLFVEDSDLIKVLRDYYHIPIKLQGEIQIQIVRDILGSRLALIKIPILFGEDESFRNIGILIKESTLYELDMTSIVNKLLPYNSPHLFRYDVIENSAWLWLENITTWLDDNGNPRYRVYETLIDGLFEIHNQTFDSIDIIEKTFPNIRKIEKQYIIDNCKQGFEYLCKTVKDKGPFLEVSQEDLDIIGKDLEANIYVVERNENLNTLIHGNYTPTTVRTNIIDKYLYVVAYDWNLSAIGWPQLDLSLLIDRISVILRYQDLPSPEAQLVNRYMWKLIDYGNDCDKFHSFYKISYFFRMFPLLIKWLNNYKGYEDRKRLQVEITCKIQTMKNF